ncbi:hypothetical protein GWK47_048555 [Chionoecetes opilio]|uniref:Uncharacterized protein n=1 Tax=Chionoecetes opilio TaxID=41210 RepID=A0A8J4YBU9_CHIOP|nr:hypothetical protein GWK47_048555 [Chionoecetes opilio]
MGTGRSRDYLVRMPNGRVWWINRRVLRPTPPHSENPQSTDGAKLPGGPSPGAESAQSALPRRSARIKTRTDAQGLVNTWSPGRRSDDTELLNTHENLTDGGDANTRQEMLTARPTPAAYTFSGSPDVDSQVEGDAAGIPFHIGGRACVGSRLVSGNPAWTAPP